MRFTEIQYLSPRIFALVAAFVIVAAVVSFLMSSPSAPNSLALATLPLAVLAVIWAIFRLETHVASDGTLTVRFRPFPATVLPSSEISTVEAICYRPLRDFGGWGIRYGAKGKMLNARGNRAVRVKLTSGDTLFVGSQYPDKLALALGK